MTPTAEKNFLHQLLARFFAPPPSVEPDEWAESGVIIMDGDNVSGVPNFTGRDYLRKPLRDCNNPKIRKKTKVWGRGLGKTLDLDLALYYQIFHGLFQRMLGIYPTVNGEGGSSNYLSTRLIPTIKKSPAFAAMLPGGQERLYMNNKKIAIGGVHCGFIGGSSAAQGVGNRLNRIDIDEVEKLRLKLGNEADIMKIAEGGTEGVAEWQINYTSTPTIETGPIWQSLMRSNLHLRFLPCPHCSSLARNKAKNATPISPIDTNLKQKISGNSRDSRKTISEKNKYSVEFAAAKALKSFAEIKISDTQAGLNESQRVTLCLSENFKGWFILAWSEQYAIGLPDKFVADGQFLDPSFHGQKIPMAYVHFKNPPPPSEGRAPRVLNQKETDSENSVHSVSTLNSQLSTAKNRDGTWNLPQVKRNTHIICPHCQTAIHDVEPENLIAGRLLADRKVWMDAHGCWICVKPGEPGHYGYQISSLYAPVINEESTWAGRAIQFLTAFEEGSEAIRTFINSVLALVEVGQSRERIQLSAHGIAQPDWVTILTADFHKNHPYIWFMVKKWCAFKLLPPFGITDGKPDFIEALDQEENADVAKTVNQLLGNPSSASPRLGGENSAWPVIAELMRFDSRTGRSPLVDFLIAQKIVGEKLVKFFREESQSDTMLFRKNLLLEMWRLAGGDPKNFRASRGGDSELIAAGYCDLSGEACWEELADIIAEFKVGKGFTDRNGFLNPNRCVGIDCGFAEKFNRTVLQKCYEANQDYLFRGCDHLADFEKEQREKIRFRYYDPLVKTNPVSIFDHAAHAACQRVARFGYQALRGKPTFRPQGSGGVSRDLGLHVEDPYYATPQGGTCVVDVLEIPTDLFWLRSHDIRTGRTKQITTISPHLSFFPKRYQPDGTRLDESKFTAEQLTRQLNEQYFDEAKGEVRTLHPKGGTASRLHPYHLGDCDTYQTALATNFEFFEDNTKK